MSKNSEWKLWLHAFTPSLASAVISITLLILILAFHLLLLANDPDLVVYELAGTRPDDRLTQLYVSVIQQPLDNAFGSDTLGILSTVVIWGFVGWAIYGIADFLISNIKTIKGSSTEIIRPNKGKVIRHPLRRQLAIRLLWRFFIGLTLVVATLAMQPYVINLFEMHVELLTADDMAQRATHALFILFGWLAVFHVYVVLLRLFVLRTRFYGEIIH